ncbi:MAG: hypothetical protein GY756_24740 [bacterium]|nr:hypothetical protein [bacterium]
MKVYITFGQIHVHSINGKTLDKDCVAAIECNDYSDGREKAFEYFGGVFHNCYSEKKFNDDILSYFPRGVIEI